MSLRSLGTKRRRAKPTDRDQAQRSSADGAAVLRHCAVSLQLPPGSAGEITGRDAQPSDRQRRLQRLGAAGISP